MKNNTGPVPHLRQLLYITLIEEWTTFLQWKHNLPSNSLLAYTYCLIDHKALTAQHTPESVRETP